MLAKPAIEAMFDDPEACEEDEDKNDRAEADSFDNDPGTMDERKFLQDEIVRIMQLVVDLLSDADVRKPHVVAAAFVKGLSTDKDNMKRVLAKPEEVDCRKLFPPLAERLEKIPYSSLQYKNNGRAKIDDFYAKLEARDLPTLTRERLQRLNKKTRIVVYLILTTLIYIQKAIWPEAFSGDQASHGEIKPGRQVI